MPKPIMETLRDIRAGALLTEATDALAELVRAITDTGKGGSLAIVLKLKPAGRGSINTIVVDASVDKKLPEPDREVSVFFPTREGELTKNDPNQMSLGLRPIPSGPVPDNVDADTGEIRTA